MSVADRTCRTCGKASESEDEPNLFSLYNYNSTKYESEIKIILEEFEIWNLNIAQNDGLPQQICLICFDSFCQIHNFRVMCVEAQMNFGEMCTGLDIFINDDVSEENYDYAENFQIQEHYTFPGDELLKSSISPLPPADVADTEEKPLVSEKKDLSQLEPLDEESQAPNGIMPESKKYRCEFCMEIVSFDDPDHLNEHYNKLHSTNLPYTCPKCDKCFDVKAKRNSHARIHFQNVNECQKCHKKVRGGKEMMWQHYENYHVVKDRVCLICGQEFKMISMKRFNYHLHWHDDTKLHKCKFCEKRFIQTTHLAVHERVHTGEMPFKCNQCDLAFKNSHLLSNHAQVHGARNLKCPHCPKKFFHNHSMKMHMKIHNEDKKYPHCDLCDITYRSPMNLRLHNYKMHGATPSQSVLNILRKRGEKHPIIKPYKCADCPEAFVLHTQLVKHLKTHSENRPFSCKICLKAFKRLAHLKLHMDSLHLNKKPFKCSDCGWAFPQRNNLNDHIAAKHGDKKEFKCNVCPREFATVKSLKTHMIKHSEKKPFVCTVCDKSFKQLIVLKTHMNGHLRKNEADITGGDITDIVVEDELEESKDV